MKRQNGLLKIALVALIAGLIGGGGAYYGISYFQNNDIINQATAIPSGSNNGGTAKVSNVKVNVQNQSEKAFQSVKDSVVSVINLKRDSSSENPFASLFGGSSSPSKKGTLEANSEGSGVIYKTSGNAAYIVTNNHVVAGSSALEVIMSNGKRAEAQLVGRDTMTDLAVLKINSSMVNKIATFGNSDNIKVGETALAIGSPLGSSYASSLTQGIISAKHREVQVPSNGSSAGNIANVIQTDAAINPGNSGGPLINLAGQVVGINSMKLASDSEGTSVEGMGFAIPSNEVTKIINQLVKNGKVVRPVLGIEYVDLTNIPSKDQSKVLKLPSSVHTGAVVMKVVQGSAAANAGLKQYDVITSLAGKKITSQAQIRDVLLAQKIGSTIPVTYYENGHVKTAQIKLTKQSSNVNFK
ncbi:serine protease [Philodulcilactobacillus myokoensis]|uniref:Serine protease n=1 Tax=Philodulcilactobacillus myokoensis TaxID=2929573 RepID=A0A9W6ESL0_9LACO|nr:trypsin-like peptidase domain-containing protein [Philodulcilactobacillus myokoensis]GLB46254.1 serine protease [Philodulcilactobacillus myokoensis]